MEILVSYIVPVYEVEDYILKQCIKSIKKYTKVSYEIVVIDDGTSINKANKYEELSNLGGIRYVRFNTNLGVSAARNYGINISTGKYISFVDADDELIHPIKKEFFEDESQLIICNVLLNKKNNMIEYGLNIGKSDIEISKKELRKKMLYDSIMNWPVAKFYLRKKIIENSILFDTDLISGEDFKFNFQIINDFHIFKYLNTPIYKYNYSESTYTARLINNPYKMLKSINNIADIRLKLLKEIGIDDAEIKRRCYSDLIGKYFSTYITLLKINSDLVERQKLLKYVAQRLDSFTCIEGKYIDPRSKVKLAIFLITRKVKGL